MLFIRWKERNDQPTPNKASVADGDYRRDFEGPGPFRIDPEWVKQETYIFGRHRLLEIYDDGTPDPDAAEVVTTTEGPVAPAEDAPAETPATQPAKSREKASTRPKSG